MFRYYLCFSSGAIPFHLCPRILEMSELWSSGLRPRILLRSSRAQIMNAFIGLFTWLRFSSLRVSRLLLWLAGGEGSVEEGEGEEGVGEVERLSGVSSSRCWALCCCAMSSSILRCCSRKLCTFSCSISSIRPTEEASGGAGAPGMSRASGGRPGPGEATPSLQGRDLRLLEAMLPCVALM